MANRDTAAEELALGFLGLAAFDGWPGWEPVDPSDRDEMRGLSGSAPSPIRSEAGLRTSAAVGRSPWQNLLLPVRDREKSATAPMDERPGRAIVLKLVLSRVP